MDPPVYHSQNSTTFLDPTRQNPNNINVPQCIIDFTVPQTMKAPVFINYRLTNFYQNHRQYIKSYNSDQLMGHSVNQAGVDSTCSPLGSSNGKIMYPCGLIANSVYNGKSLNHFFFFFGLRQKPYGCFLIMVTDDLLLFRYDIKFDVSRW